MSGSNRYQIYKNDSPVDNYVKSQDLNIPRSKHNFSKTKVGQALPYLYMPVDCFDVVPNEQISIDVTSYLNLRSPANRELMNGCKVMFEAVYNRSNDLWEGSENFYDNGRRGDVSLTIPKLIYKVSVTEGEGGSYPLSFYKDNTLNAGSDHTKGIPFTVNSDTPLSLMDFFGLHASIVSNNADNSSTPQDIAHTQPLHWFKTSILSDDSLDNSVYISYKNTGVSLKLAGSNIVGNNHTDINALPFMAYQRNWRDFHSDKNLLQNNKYWFPDNEAHFILSYNTTNAVCINYDHESLNYNNGDDNTIGNQVRNLLGYWFTDLGDEYDPYRNSVLGDFALNARTPEPNNPSTIVGEYFDSISESRFASYFAPNLAGIKFVKIEGDRFSTSSPFPDLVRGTIPTVTMTVNDLLANVNLYKDNADSPVLKYYNGTSSDDTQTDMQILLDSDNSRLGYRMDSGAFGAGTVAGLKAEIPPIVSSFTWQDVKALEAFTVFRTRLGMTNGDYNEMIKAQFGISPKAHDHQGTWLGSSLQTFNFSGISQTSESNSTPLGTIAGQGSSSGNSNICTNFSVPDFGWVQVYMYIVPDTLYTQGTPRMFSKLSALEQYFPIFNELAPQYIKNKELFATGDSSIDELPFGYEPRYEEYKGRENEVCGLSALPHSVADYDASRVMARRFSETPNLNHEFITGVPENVDYSVFSVTDEPPFDFALGLGVTRVFPGPYMSVNADTMKIGG